MSDLLAEGITIVEDVYKNREPVPNLKAIYFISPTAKSIDALLNDFKAKAPYKYKAAYIYFTDYCPDSFFEKIKLHCSKSVKTCKEVNLSFLPYESQVFTVDIPEAFQRTYSPERKDDRDAVIQTLAEHLVTLCATLDENPGVRYKGGPGQNNAKQLAKLVEEKLTDYYKTDEKCRGKGKTQSQLLIVDRGFDPVSPILHELTYQAMAYDLLPIENGVYKYPSKDESDENKKEALLDEDDELWIKLRHLHIAEVSEQIPKLVKQITNEKKKATEGKVTMSSLSQLLKKMPLFRKNITKQAVHLNLAEDCLEAYRRNVFEKLCKAEQDLALGTDVEGVKIKDAMRVLLPIVINADLANYDKIRAILLYIFSLNGTTEENLKKIIQHAKIENDSELILNWKHLNVPIFSSLSSQQRKPARKDRSVEEMYQLSRWTPIIKDIMEDIIDNKLDSKEWPHCSECAAAWNGSGAVSARQKTRTNYQEDRKNGIKLIIFIIGGLAYSEMRCAYEVTKTNTTCEVIIGSTHILTPKGLLDDLKALGKPKDSVSIAVD
nr:PREDICTED: syntaxin-binding protein 3 isoform X2 [Latimeria chalumnae]|eukprot:XP_014344968.1 PREDICTED: syntaxin-binding protein 3 isoform X2 [Latimeria chalumnae]